MPVRLCRQPSLSVSVRAVFAAVLLLPACGPDDRGEGATTPETAEALESYREGLERRAPGCGADEDCASVAIDWAVFEGRPALSRAVREQLLWQLDGDGETRQAAGSLDAVADAFIADAARMDAAISTAGWRLTGGAKLLARRGDLITVQIDSYSYTGGAHGLPVTKWFNWDLATDEPVSLQHVLEPGRDEAFWSRARVAHERWLSERPEADDSFRDAWPFQQSDDFRFDDRGLVLLYNVYTLGPYSIGQVELTVPWDEVRGVAKEEYLPAPGH